MSFLKKLFGSKKSKTPEYEALKEGDIFYTERSDKYHIYKLLKIDVETNTFHLKKFFETTKIPTIIELENLEVKLDHSPVSGNGIFRPKVIANQAISDNELKAYLLYSKQIKNIDDKEFLSMVSQPAHG